MARKVSVVVLGYGPEPYLEACLSALAADLPPDGEILLVDNAIEGAAHRRAGWPVSVRVLGDGVNRGFAGGCNLGAQESCGDVLVFVNSDAVVRPGAVRRLASVVVDDASVGLACGCLRLADSPDLVNSVGNPLHFVGITWAGACGEPAADHLLPGEVTIATGGLFAARRTVWERLGGFDETYFAYHEDTDLSIRTWLTGLRVVVEPRSVADHHYEFARNPRKMYLLERNRFLTVLTDYPSSLLLRVLPALVVVEPLLLVLATVQGWAPQKLRAWGWILSHSRYLRQRRRQVQATAAGTDPAGCLARRMTGRIEPPMVTAPPGMGLVNRVLEEYWSRVAGRAVRAGSR